MSQLKVHNSYTRQKEVFVPLTPGHVGMYVCGPTVSGESHLGHARPFITFDFIYRYLLHLGYKVRYVRNITDAGHFEEEGREAEDKISKKAVIEKLEPILDAGAAVGDLSEIVLAQNLLVFETERAMVGRNHL